MGTSGTRATHRGYRQGLRFWRAVCGSPWSSTDPMIDLDGAQIMLDEIDKTRDWVTGPLERRTGRCLLEPEEKWYRTGEVEIEARQFLVQDPDGCT
jgi:hypothetical protein